MAQINIRNIIRTHSARKMRIGTMVFLLGVILSCQKLMAQSANDSIPVEETKERYWPKIRKGLYFDASGDIVNGPGNKELATSLELGLTFSVIDLAFFINRSHGDHEADLIFPNTFELDYLYGGVHLGTNFRILSYITIKPSINIGRGDMIWSRKEEDEVFSRDEFNAIHPQLRVGFAPFKFVNIYGKAGYRFINKLNLQGVTPSDFDGYTFGCGVSFYLTNE
ncbi:MAG: hypothetical protein JXR10_01650 [Cyclobacteriaceae bacterium]